MSKWNGFNGPITAADAENEPERDRLFGSSYDARQRQIKARIDRETRIDRDPWKKPRIQRQSAAKGMNE